MSPPVTAQVYELLQSATGEWWSPRQIWEALPGVKRKSVYKALSRLTERGKLNRRVGVRPTPDGYCLVQYSAVPVGPLATMPHNEFWSQVDYTMKQRIIAR